MSTMAKTGQPREVTWLTLISRKGSENFKEGRDRRKYRVECGVWGEAGEKP